MHLDRSNKTRSPHSTNAAASTRSIHAHLSRDSIVSDASSTSVHHSTNFMYLSHAHSFNARFSGFPATSCRARVWLESGSSVVRASTRGVRALLDDHHRSQARTHSACTAYTYHDAKRCSPSSAECRACAACHIYIFVYTYMLCVFVYTYMDMYSSGHRLLIVQQKQEQRLDRFHFSIYCCFRMYYMYIYIQRS